MKFKLLLQITRIWPFLPHHIEQFQNLIQFVSSNLISGYTAELGLPGTIYFKSLVPISNRGAVAPHIISASPSHEDNIPTARKKLLLRQTTTIWANMGLKCNFHCVRIKKKDQMVLHPPPESPSPSKNHFPGNDLNFAHSMECSDSGGYTNCVHLNCWLPVPKKLLLLLLWLLPSRDNVYVYANSVPSKRLYWH